MNVSKKFSFSFIFLAILFWVGFGLLRMQANEDGDNFFNRNLRASFIKSDTLRRIFHLNFDGDARAFYFSKNKITVEVVWMEGVFLDREAISRAVENISKVTGNEVTVEYNNYPISSLEAGSSLSDLEKKYRDISFSPSKPSLLLMALPYDVDNKSRIGTTLGSTTVVLYVSAIDDLVSKNKEQVSKLQEGTVLHEFGHQLGLDHNNKEGCLMNPQAEINGSYGASNWITNFCEYELETLSKLRESYRKD